MNLRGLKGLLALSGLMVAGVVILLGIAVLRHGNILAGATIAFFAFMLIAVPSIDALLHASRSNNPRSG